MCCNGTLFNYVTLMPDDLPKLAKYPQLRFKERNGQTTFDEPCVLHTGTGCSAYDDRPGTCSRYICGVLKAVAKDELTELEAVGVLKEARALVDNVKELIHFPPEEPLAISTWDGPPEHLSDEARLAWERVTYHLQKHFLHSLKDAPAATPGPRLVHEVDERPGKKRVPRRERAGEDPKTKPERRAKGRRVAAKRRASS